jgi:hypothetical protein
VEKKQVPVKFDTHTEQFQNKLLLIVRTVCSWKETIEKRISSILVCVSGYFDASLLLASIK